MDEMQPQVEGEQPQGEAPEMTPINPELPPEAQQLIEQVRGAIAQSRETIAQTLEQAADGGLGKVAALLTFTAMQEGQQASGPVDPEILFMAEGVGDYLLDVIFAIAQQAGLPGADDVANYHAAQDALDEMGESFGVEDQDGMAAGERGAEQVPEESPMPRGRPVMAGGA